MLEPANFMLFLMLVGVVILLWVTCWMYETELKRMKKQNKLLHTCLNDAWKDNRQMKQEIRLLHFEKIFYEMTHTETPEK